MRQVAEIGQQEKGRHALRVTHWPVQTGGAPPDERAPIVLGPHRDDPRGRIPAPEPLILARQRRGAVLLRNRHARSPLAAAPSAHRAWRGRKPASCYPAATAHVKPTGLHMRHTWRVSKLTDWPSICC